MQPHERPTWVHIDLAAFASNIRHLKALTGTRLTAVVKANAYGHGLLPIARAAVAGGADALAVATIGEVAALRDASIGTPVLILGYLPPWQAAEAVRLGARCALFDMALARALSDAAVAQQRTLNVHIKVDTGMTRLGLQPDPAQVVVFLQAVALLPGLHIEGLFTHFATADSGNETFARLQLERFRAVLQAVTSAGMRPPIIHAANSPALLRFPESHFDMVRPGLACYGLHPSPATPLPPALQPVLSWHSTIAQVNEVPAGIPVSYGGTFITRRPSRIATMPVGYGDGFRRSPPWREVLVQGQRAPLVGRICMDYSMLDVTEIDGVQAGDAVVLLGRQGMQHITAEEVADWLGTINYEVVTAILPRVPRVAA